MPRYVALLRGIAPTNPKMRNENLRNLFEGLGFSNVKTVIASGNIVFESPSRSAKKLEAMIEKALPEQLGFSSTTIIRSRAQLQELVKKDPFRGREHKKEYYLNVTFLKKTTGTAKKLTEMPGDRSIKVLGMDAGAIYSAVDLTSGTTPDLMLWLEKKFGKEITTRTWKTVERILKAME